MGLEEDRAGEPALSPRKGEERFQRVLFQNSVPHASQICVFSAACQSSWGTALPEFSGPQISCRSLSTSFVLYLALNRGFLH